MSFRVAAVAVIVIAITATVRHFWFADTLESAATKVAASLKSFKAGPLWKYEHPSERRLLSMNRAKLQRILDEYVKPSFSGYIPVRLKKDQMYAGATEYSAGCQFRNAQGRTTWLGVGMDVTDEGPRANCVSIIVVQTMLTRWSTTSVEDLAGMDRVRVLNTAVKNDRRLLESLGLAGIVEPDSAGDRLITWDEWIKQTDELLDKGFPAGVIDPEKETVIQ
ncbi:MAG: hypothetical protein QOJ65_1532 [Fimbriimonadaceae bacterium]|jgi:hypothetical protein|nr:hypothetical protein [Fimbriimonadaceae bacterium]